MRNVLNNSFTAFMPRSTYNITLDVTLDYHETDRKLNSMPSNQYWYEIGDFNETLLFAKIRMEMRKQRLIAEKV